MTDRLAVGISTCPNDTFAFHGLLTGAVRPDGFDVDLALGDVEEWNARLDDGSIDVAKGSFSLAVERSCDFVVLGAGSALGFGVGPVLLARPDAPPLDERARVLAPGRRTTANLLLRLLHPELPPAGQVVFSDIMPALASGDADYGVCIHEGRFTYEAAGLVLAEDLGASWERRARSPLPLGGILARRAVGDARIAALSSAVRRSIDHARAHPRDALATMREYAQEQSDDVLWKHVELYVNDWTRALGAGGGAALAALSRAAREAGLVSDAPDLAVVDADEPNAAPRCFHLVRPADWSGRATDSWSPPSIATEGFLHASHADQLPGTLRAHYADADDLLLLELDRDCVAHKLVREASRGGALFPHLYRPLEPADVARWWRITRDGDAWSLPTFARDASRDVPSGTPGAPA